MSMNHHWKRLASATVVFLLFGVGAVAVHAGQGELHADFRPPRSRPLLPKGVSLSRLQNISFWTDQGDDIHGWWQPGTRESAIVFLHGSSGNREQLEPEAELVARAGYGVLLFDSPGHGESSGRVTWSQTEPSALRQALTFAQTHGARHLGIFAFSLGTLIAVQVAAHDPRVEALILAGAPPHLDDVIRHDFRHLRLFTQWPALLAARSAGFRSGNRNVAMAVHSPTLFIVGAMDDCVPVELSRHLYAAVSGPKEMWIIHNAGHGDYRIAAGPEFERRVIAFFDETLRDK